VDRSRPYTDMADWSVRSRSSAHAPIRGAAARGEETLLIEWPKGPTKYWLSTLDKDKSFCTVVDRAKMRWRFLRNYGAARPIPLVFCSPLRHLRRLQAFLSPGPPQRGGEHVDEASSRTPELPYRRG